MPHMPATAVSGLDLYVKSDDGTKPSPEARFQPIYPIPSADARQLPRYNISQVRIFWATGGSPVVCCWERRAA
jgi:hypothetical protein